MPRNTIAVCSNTKELGDRLTEVCPPLSFIAFNESDPAPPPQVMIIDEGFSSTIPLHGRSRVRIFLSAEPAGEPRRFGDLRLPKEQFLAAPCEYIAFAQDLAMTASRAIDLEQEVDLFSEVRDLMSLSESSLVFEKITHALVDILRLEAGSIFLYDPKTERFTPAFSNEGQGSSPESIAADLARALDQSAPKVSFFFRPPDLKAGVITIPIQIREDLIGFFTASVPVGAEIEEHMTDRASRYLRAMTAVIANVHQITSSKDLAMRDDLTKAYNRRFFEAYLDEEIERARRYGSVLSIIFLDLDDLKNVNSLYGHLMGSRVLQEVAKRVLAAVRAIDKVVRFGGDEFCIILPQTDQVQARNVANRVRRALVESVFEPEADIVIGISASFGIATYPYHAVTKEDLIRQADDAMFRIKSSTKNAIGIAGDVDVNRRVTNGAS